MERFTSESAMAPPTHTSPVAEPNRKPTPKSADASSATPPAASTAS